MRHLNIDIETYSDVDIRTGGLYKYVQAPAFEILLFAFSVDGAAPVVIDLACGETIPSDIMSALFNPAVTKHAYNAAFEWYSLCKYFGLLNQGEQATTAWLAEWRDTMLHAMYCGYPASLAEAGKALALPASDLKKTTGSALIRTFCTPRKPTARDTRTRVYPQQEPEKWQLFKEYNAQDVAAEMAIEHKLASWPVPAELEHQWQQDIKMNAYGVAVDLDLVIGALHCADILNAELTAEAAKITGLENPNSVAQLKDWVETETGAELSGLTKADVQTLLAGDLKSQRVRRALEIRQELSKTSIKKFNAMENAMCADGRVRGVSQFYGANRTGRWAGRLVQMQNLPRTNLAAVNFARSATKKQNETALQMVYGSVQDTLSQLIRTAFIPSPGCLFVDADFSAIEARVIAWLAGEQWRLDVFSSHGKIYEASASQMFGVPLEHIVKGRPEYSLRQRGKVAELALGYAGGTPALINMGALKMGIPENELPELVHQWRTSNPRIVGLWRSVQKAALEAVETGRQMGLNGLFFHLETDHTNQQFLTIALPSGRKLFYARPFVTQGDYGDNLHYFGVHQQTRTWVDQETYGGKLVENIVQAIARDCLAVALERLEQSQYRVVFHVHDEVVVEHPADGANQALEDICKLISAPIGWAPGLPLGADGWVGEYYTKD